MFGFRLSVLAGCLICVGVGVCRTDNLEEGFAVLSGAASDAYSRGGVHSAPAALAAAAKLPDLAESAPPAQREMAMALIEPIGKDRVADLETAQAAYQLKADERSVWCGLKRRCHISGSRSLTS